MGDNSATLQLAAMINSMTTNSINNKSSNPAQSIADIINAQKTQQQVPVGLSIADRINKQIADARSSEPIPTSRKPRPTLEQLIDEWISDDPRYMDHLTGMTPFTPGEKVIMQIGKKKADDYVKKLVLENRDKILDPKKLPKDIQFYMTRLITYPDGTVHDVDQMVLRHPNGTCEFTSGKQMIDI